MGLMVEEDSSNIEPKLRRRDVFFALGFVGLAAYGTYDLSSKAVFGIGSRIATAISPNLESVRADQPVFPKDSSGNRSIMFDYGLNNLLTGSLFQYLEWERYGQQLQSMLNLHQAQPLQTVELLETVGKNFIIQGVNTLKISWLMGKSQDQLALDDSGKNLWINQLHFDLNDRYEGQLASAWIGSKVMLINKSLTLSQASPEDDLGEIDFEINNLQDDLRLLTWLKERHPKILFEEETYAFFPRDEMVKMARIYQQFDLIGLNPQQLKWCSPRCLDNFDKPEKDIFFGGIAEYSKNSMTIESNNHVRAVAHEGGHLKSIQGNLLSDFKLIRGQNGEAPAVDILNCVTPYAMKNGEEDFASTFEEYLLRGEYFRLRLQVLEAHDKKAWQALNLKYNFMKNEVFGGREYEIDAKPRVPILEEMEKDFLGLKWSSQEGFKAELRPDPNAYPGKRRIELFLPIVKPEGIIEDVKLSFSYSPRRQTYTVSVSDYELIPEITFYPLPGSDRIAIDENWVHSHESAGALSSVRIRPALVQAKVPSFALQSFTPVLEGENRRILDNSYPMDPRPIYLRRTEVSEEAEEQGFGLRDLDLVTVLQGPVEGFFGYSGKNERFWLVKPNLAYEEEPGWISERWLGQDARQTPRQNR